MAARWTQDFDIGRFDDLHCDRDDWSFPSSHQADEEGLHQKQQCPYNSDQILDDLLETEKLLEWHEGEGLREKPHMGHTNLNYHAKAFEQVDHYLRNVLAILKEPQSYFKGAC